MTDRQGEAAAREFYDTHYRNIATDVHAQIRQAIYGDHFGQTGAQTADEQDRIIRWLDLGPTSRVLDIACGAGGPSLRMARLTGCSVVGIDIQEQGITTATEAAQREGLAARARFERHDANEPLPFPDASFDAVVCIDAINHLADRPAVLREWARVLKPGGRLAFTDPITVTGPLSKEEIATRSSIGPYLFVPPGYDAHVIEGAGLDLLVQEDSTATAAALAARWVAARTEREDALRRLDGDEVFEAQQAHLAVAERLSRERRLSRFIFVAAKPAQGS